jgi:hypothetical protein
VVSNANPGMVEINKRWGSCLTTSLHSYLIADSIMQREQELEISLS